MERDNVLRDNACHVVARECSTCIFIDQSFLAPGRLKQMIRDCQRKDTYIICHSTLKSEEYKGGTR